MPSIAASGSRRRLKRSDRPDMNVFSHTIEVSTRGNTDIIDITADTREALEESGLTDGIAVISTVGSTSAITTCEYEPGLVRDLKEIVEKLIPRRAEYAHNSSWGGSDGNAHSHLRASLIGPSLTLIFEGGLLLLGTWQQILFIDFDNRPRKRKIHIQLIGSREATIK